MIAVGLGVAALAFAGKINKGYLSINVAGEIFSNSFYRDSLGDLPYSEVWVLRPTFSFLPPFTATEHLSM